jgi:hypothetical protein
MISVLIWMALLLSLCFIVLSMCAYFLSKIAIGIHALVEAKHSEQVQAESPLLFFVRNSQSFDSSPKQAGREVPSIFPRS